MCIRDRTSKILHFCNTLEMLIFGLVYERWIVSKRLVAASDVFGAVVADVILRRNEAGILIGHVTTNTVGIFCINLTVAAILEPRLTVLTFSACQECVVIVEQGSDRSKIFVIADYCANVCTFD